MLIEIQDVSVERGSTRILNRVNLNIPQGQHVAIVGPNGSGKSTLLKLLMKFYYPSVVDGQSGAIRILGQEEWNIWELRRHLGFVSSEIDHHFTVGRSARLNALHCVLTGFFSAELDPDPSDITRAMREDAEQALEWFQVNSKSSKAIGHMSTGERRRVLLARAMVQKPQAIVLDEPTTGLDILARADLLRILNQLAGARTQVVLVTHHLEEILPSIQRTILLKAGEVFLDTQTHLALSEDSISALFEAPIRIDLDASGYFHSRIV
jgi:iron complex transport system ATP-binding protein